MKTNLLIAILTLSMAVAAGAQATNDGFLSLTVNGNAGGGVSPILTSIVVPNVMSIDIDGTPTAPFALGSAPSIAIGTILAGPISVDIGPAPQLLMNGISPVNLLDFFAFVGLGGTTNFTIPLQTSLVPGVLAGLQVVSVDATAPGGVADSAATQVTLVSPIDYGTITYFKGSTIEIVEPYAGVSGVGTAPLGGSAPLIDFEGLNTNAWGEIVSNTTNSIRWQQDPAVVGPQSSSNNSFSDYINTIHGRLFSIEDLTAPTSDKAFAYMLIATPGAVPTILTDTIVTNGIFSTSPWVAEVAISADQSTMAAVLNPALSGLPDRIFLIKLDGSTFASSGTGLAEITPAGSTLALRAESMRFVSDRVYFSDGNSTGNFFSAPADGSAVATVVTLPNTGVGLPVTAVDGENFHHLATDTLFIQGGNGTSTEDIFAITHPGGVETITNITNFAVATELEEFGDGNEGFDGQFAVSPDASRCAFVTLEGGDDELYWVTTDGLGTPAQLTDITVFDVTIDDFIELNFYDNNHILAWGGTSTSSTDLYDFDITLAPTLTLTNLTATNMQDGSVLPITTAMNATANPAGQIDLGDRMIFIRDGNQVSGLSAGSSVLNIAGFIYSSMTLYDILGDEFGSPTAVFGGEPSAPSLDLTFLPGSDVVVFNSKVNSTTNDEDIHSFDSSMTAHSVNLSNFGGVGSENDNIATDDAGVSVAFSRNLAGDEELYLGLIGLPSSSFQISNVEGGFTDIGDATVVFTAPGAPIQGVLFSAGTNSDVNPSDAHLLAVDLGNFLTTNIDTEDAVFRIAAISYP